MNQRFQELAFTRDAGGVIVTAPTIRSPIQGSAEISGAFDRERAEHLAKAINDAARTASTQPSR
jgi:preprotein translocase subunit SecD